MRALLVACLPAMGCLVADKVKIREEQNVPPSIRTLPSAPHPLNEVVVLDGDLDPEALTRPVQFEVEIRDENIEQKLEFVVLLNATPNAVVADEIAAPGQSMDASGTGGAPQLREPLRFSISAGALTLNQCNRIELRVSSAFQRFQSVEPVDPDDIAKVYWWIFPKEHTEVRFDPVQCPGRQ